MLNKGKIRDESCLQELLKLNPYVAINILKKNNTDPDLKYNIFCLTFLKTKI